MSSQVRSGTCISLHGARRQSTISNIKKKIFSLWSELKRFSCKTFIQRVKTMRIKLQKFISGAGSNLISTRNWGNVPCKTIKCMLWKELIQWHLISPFPSNNQKLNEGKEKLFYLWIEMRQVRQRILTSCIFSSLCFMRNFNSRVQWSMETMRMEQ